MTDTDLQTALNAAMQQPDQTESKRPSGACLWLVIIWGLILVIVVALSAFAYGVYAP